jgi:hypothetical protein
MAKRDAAEADAQAKRPKRAYLPLTTPSTQLDPAPPQSFFDHLPRDIRNLIYDHLAFSPLAHISDDASGSALALTCHQAHAEAQEAAARHLWLFWLWFKAEHTDCEAKLPLALHSTETLFGTKTLTICLNGAVSAFLPACVQDVTLLQLNDLVIHYTGDPQDEDEKSNLPDKTLDLLCDAMSDYGKWAARFTLQRLTVSWDFRANKHVADLTGTFCELNATTTEWLCRKFRDGDGVAESATKWPTVLYASDEKERVGMFKLEVGTRSPMGVWAVEDLVGGVQGMFIEPDYDEEEDLDPYRWPVLRKSEGRARYVPVEGGFYW